MLIPVCDRCKKEKVQGLLCKHCDSSYCYDCLDTHPSDIHMCPFCEDFICEECHSGMVACDLPPKKKKQPLTLVRS
ncbi:MAG: hypothetical protein ACYDG6_07125 [Thermincolia bacterium]